APAHTVKSRRKNNNHHPSRGHPLAIQITKNVSARPFQGDLKQIAAKNALPRLLTIITERHY
ncbi:hypothetical protein AB6846_17945, partial [Serratia proteamaculans]